MRMTRLYVDLALESGSVIELPPGSAAHVAKVLRARSGDAVMLFRGDGLEYAGLIETVRGARVAVVVGAVQQIERESPLALTLLQCLPRGDRMDLIVQKATELGVARIVPALSQRSIMRIDAKQAEAKRAHWHAIAVSACEQCGRARLPDIDLPRPLLTVLGEAQTLPEFRLLLEPEGPQHALPAPPLTRACVAIGPEGGLASEELEAFRLAGFAGRRLGPRILRTETAAIAALAWLQTLAGDLAV
jgi:16S rRNA (uracil1498-N3)-methyltransferase